MMKECLNMMKTVQPPKCIVVLSLSQTRLFCLLKSNLNSLLMVMQEDSWRAIVQAGSGLGPWCASAAVQPTPCEWMPSNNSVHSYSLCTDHSNIHSTLCAMPLMLPQALKKRICANQSQKPGQTGGETKLFIQFLCIQEIILGLIIILSMQKRKLPQGT